MCSTGMTGGAADAKRRVKKIKSVTGHKRNDGKGETVRRSQRETLV